MSRSRSGESMLRLGRRKDGGGWGVRASGTAVIYDFSVCVSAVVSCSFTETQSHHMTLLLICLRIMARHVNEARTIDRTGVPSQTHASCSDVTGNKSIGIPPPYP
ncbi:hypothetical protein PENSPDRAFT_273016 [Peniophora sp. CONT]|nr:hypothetical protein PENSPDRAFT_273016 [Peniophora sp. CONT]